MSAEHWGRRPRDWAELAEPSNRPLFEQRARPRSASARGRGCSTSGCGSGYALAMAAAARGHGHRPRHHARAARDRRASACPAGDARPRRAWTRCRSPTRRFDVVVGFNALPFADDPARGGARGGARRRGPAAWSPRRRSPSPSATSRPRCTWRSSRCAPPAPRAGAQHLPYALSEPGGLERAARRRPGLEPCRAARCALVWAHDDVDEAVRAVLASGGGAMAIEARRRAGRPRRADRGRGAVHRPRRARDDAQRVPLRDRAAPGLIGAIAAIRPPGGVRPRARRSPPRARPAPRRSPAPRGSARASRPCLTTERASRPDRRSAPPRTPSARPAVPPAPHVAHSTSVPAIVTTDR